MKFGLFISYYNRKDLKKKKNHKKCGLEASSRSFGQVFIV